MDPFSLLELAARRIAKVCQKGVIVTTKGLEGLLPSDLVDRVCFFVEFSPLEWSVLYDERTLSAYPIELLFTYELEDVFWLTKKRRPDLDLSSIKAFRGILQRQKMF
jgi:hypothetical protein